MGHHGTHLHPHLHAAGIFSRTITGSIQGGDSVTNIISPMMSFFALIIVFFQKYQKNAGFGTIMANMLPYSIAFFVGWVLLLILWIILGLPLGPESPINYIPS